MPSHIEAVTTAALSAALDGASRRQALIAANIANAGTESYQPLRLPFEAHLEEARGAWREHGLRDTRLVEALRSAATLPAEPVEGSSVRMDVEMAELARNAVQFQALVQGVSRHLSLLALAAADGRK